MIQLDDVLNTAYGSQKVEVDDHIYFIMSSSVWNVAWHFWLGIRSIISLMCTFPVKEWISTKGGIE